MYSSYILILSRLAIGSTTGTTMVNNTIQLGISIAEARPDQWLPDGKKSVHRDRPDAPSIHAPSRISQRQMSGQAQPAPSLCASDGRLACMPGRSGGGCRVPHGLASRWGWLPVPAFTPECEPDRDGPPSERAISRHLPGPPAGCAWVPPSRLDPLELLLGAGAVVLDERIACNVHLHDVSHLLKKA